MLLARYMTQTARDDYSYMRPSRREGQMILPSLRSEQADIVVAIDTSGSVSGEELNEFLAEINMLKGQLRARITLHACDTALAEGGPWIFEPWEEIKLPREFQGGGGTDFRPVFGWVERQGRSPDLLLYFTDAEGDFPAATPPYPVIWLVKGKAPVPWGQRIQLN
jgi:predicted metal-dependent peptidase